MEKIKLADYEQVLAVVEQYTKSCQAGKSDIMKPAFHPDAIMYGYLNGKLYDGSIQALYDAVDQFGESPQTKARIDILSIEGTAASVRVTIEDWHGLAFTDFHSLLKIDGKWQIIAKVFHQY